MHTSSDQPQALPSAPLGKRLFAMVYDLFILVALSMAYSALLTAAIALLSAEPNPGDYRPMHSGPWYGLGWLAVIAGFFWFFFKRAGQTVGMRAWRLKIVNENGEALAHWQCLVRILVAPLSMVFFGLGYLWCLFHPSKSTWQDLASRSRVVFVAKPKSTEKSKPKSESTAPES